MLQDTRLLFCFATVLLCVVFLLLSMFHSKIFKTANYLQIIWGYASQEYLLIGESVNTDLQIHQRLLYSNPILSYTV